MNEINSQEQLLLLLNTVINLITNKIVSFKKKKQRIQIMGQLLGRQKSKGLCAICLEKMPMKSISALRCGHLFHFRCIKYWLTEQETCPECRKPSKLDDIVTSLYFHDDMVDRKSDITDTHSGEDSLDEFEKQNNYNDLLKKLDNAYLELKSEKALHEQTKEFLEKVQWEKLELISIIQTMIGND
ncbi:Ring finger domain family protein [Acanthocheilonema viteae]